jgi:Restriction endonuclease
LAERTALTSARDGRDFESLTELVVRLLSRQTETTTRELRRRARVRGRSTTHEIDVWWEPEVGGTRRQVAFQCKDLTRPVDQGEMLKFRAVLDDLDEETLGVFVARGSYQRGAIMVAAMSNILRLSIDRIGDDEEVLVEHTEILDAEIKLRRDDIDRDRATGEDDLYGDEVIFYDENGHVRGNLLQIAFVMLERVPSSAEPATRTRRFREPTYIRDRDGELHRVSSLTITGRAVRDAPLARMIIELLDMRED